MKHFPMLSCNADPGFKVGPVLVQFKNNRRQFDCFRPSAYDDHYLFFMFVSIQILPSRFPGKALVRTTATQSMASRIHVYCEVLTLVTVIGEDHAEFELELPVGDVMQATSALVSVSTTHLTRAIFDHGRFGFGPRFTTQSKT